MNEVKSTIAIMLFRYFLPLILLMIIAYLITGELSSSRMWGFLAGWMTCYFLKVESAMKKASHE